DHHDVVPARQQLAERRRGQQELQLAGGAVLVQRAQAAGEPRLLPGQRIEVALEVRARHLELDVEVPPAILERAQAPARRAQLLLGAAELNHGAALLALELARGLALLARLAVQLVQLAALLGFEAVRGRGLGRAPGPEAVLRREPAWQRREQ